jgi:hypothetical protein
MLSFWVSEISTLLRGMVSDHAEYVSRSASSSVFDFRMFAVEVVEVVCLWFLASVCRRSGQVLHSGLAV